MAGTQGNSSDQSLFGTFASWGNSIVGYAQDTLNNVLGYEDLDVVDPEADHAVKGGTKDEGVFKEERKSIWGNKQFQQYIGMDIMSVLSVPVFIMEPVSMLQKMAEIMEYTQLLDQADVTEDPDERFALVVAYLVSPYGAGDRAWKPFNPILGETFELDVGNNVRFFAEQVSHHPPIGVAHAENQHFTYDLVSAPTTKFLGNSLEVYPLGRTRITLKTSGELYTHVPPNSKAHNLVIGRTWVDSAGDFYVLNAATGAKCVLKFTPCGWFSYGRYEFSGHICDKDGVKKVLLSGKWNSHVDSVPCSPSGEALPDAVPKRLWSITPKPEGDYYGFTKFAHRLNSCENILEPLPSDSRRRPDRAALQRGETSLAGQEKYRIEELQRAEKRQREARGDKWSARYFRKVDAAGSLPGECPADKVPFYQWTGEGFNRDRRPVEKPEEVDGQGFNPWQYPETLEKA